MEIVPKLAACQSPRALPPLTDTDLTAPLVAKSTSSGPAVVDNVPIAGAAATLAPRILRAVSELSAAPNLDRGAVDHVPQRDLGGLAGAAAESDVAGVSQVVPEVAERDLANPALERRARRRSGPTWRPRQRLQIALAC